MSLLRVVRDSGHALPSEGRQQDVWTRYTYVEDANSKVAAAERNAPPFPIYPNCPTLSVQLGPPGCSSSTTTKMSTTALL